ncbi:MAG: hypothetical protein HDT21_04630 [Ruminococcus sp.]|nr:hypothetical protein [Ruminococcus sp.]
MTIKRAFLNIGILLVIIAAFLCGIQNYENSFIKHTVGTVYSKHEYLDNFYNVTYYAGGIKYSDIKYLTDMEVNIGDKITVFYDLRSPSKVTNKKDFGALIGICAIPGLLMILSCCTAFKGYKTEFIDKIPKASKFSIISISAAVICEAFLNLYCYYTNTWKSLRMLFLGSIALLIVVPTANILVRNKYKHDKNQNSHTE